jgi:transketolase
VPESVVLSPADRVAADACVQLAAAHRGVVYLRTTRMKTPALYPADEAFAIGGLKVVRVSDADRLTIVAAGITLHEAIAAHAELARRGIPVRVIDLYSVKPAGGEDLLRAAHATGGTLLTVEDHYAEGGLGDAVQDAVGGEGVRVSRLAVREIPGSGPPAGLLERHGIGRGAIVARVQTLMAARARAA